MQMLTLFIVIFLGYLAGRLSFRGIRLGTAAIFITGLLAGHLGFAVPAAAQTLGLMFFISAVGLSSGPSFLQRLAANGLQYCLMCISIILIGAVMCLILIRGFRLSSPLVVGIMTGAYTSSPGYAAAREAISSRPSAIGELAAGYGLVYPVGTLCKVLFIQLVPKVLGADMEQERRKIALKAEQTAAERKRVCFLEPTGLYALALAIITGIALGAVTIPLPGGSTFSLGIVGGCLFSGLLLGHIGRIGRLSLVPPDALFPPLKEIGLMLFFAGAGVEGGAHIGEILGIYGFRLLLYGFLIVSIPLFAGTFLFLKVLRIPLLNGLGALTASMTCTASLAALIQTAGTDDVTGAYATVYPISLILMTLTVQLLLLL